MPKVPSRARSWSFTIQTDLGSSVPFEGGWSRLAEFSKFLIYQKEIGPDTGNVHWQGYLSLKNAKSLSAMKAIHPSAHWEVARGSCDQNIIYCTKTECRVTPPCQFGEQPAPGKPLFRIYITYLALFSFILSSHFFFFLCFLYPLTLFRTSY